MLRRTNERPGDGVRFVNPSQACERASDQDRRQKNFLVCSI